MRLLLNTVIGIALLFFLLIISGLALLQYSPQSLLSLAPYISPYRVTAEKVAIDLRTPSVYMIDVQVDNSEAEAATLSSFSFSTSWESLRKDSQEWTVRAESGVIHLNQLTSSQLEAPSEFSAPNIGDLHNILQKANIAVTNINVTIDDSTSTQLDYLRRPEALKPEEQGLAFSLTYQQNNITMPIEGTLLSTINNGIPEIALSLPTLDLRAITAAKNSDDTRSSQQQAPSSNQLTTSKQEPRIDWSSLSQFTPLTLVFDAEKIQLSQGDITALRSRIIFEDAGGSQRIRQEHSAKVDLALANDFSIKQSILATSDWTLLDTVTEGADIDGEVHITLGDTASSKKTDAKITAKGKININGWMGQEITLSAALNRFPLIARSQAAKQQKKEIEKLLPFDSQSQLRLQKNTLALNDFSINAKTSDITGSLSAVFNKDMTDLRDITFDITSNRLVIPPSEKNRTANNDSSTDIHSLIEKARKVTATGAIKIGEVVYNNEVFLDSLQTQLLLKDEKLTLSDIALRAAGSDLNGNITAHLNEKVNYLYAMTFDLDSTQITLPGTPPNTTTKQSTAANPTTVKKESLFSDELLPTGWLDTLKTDGQLNIAKVVRDGNVLIRNVNNRVTTDKNKLQLKSQIENIAGGNSTIDISLDNTKDTLSIAIDASAKNIILEQLALVSKESLSGGKTDLSLSLNSSGNSTQALASQLQGNILLTTTDGVIANNTFELIGSDIFLKLINTINPFYKSTKTTNLECAVIKSNIVDGKMLFDDSIAIKTSKMVIVANGNIDLASEKINLGINPKAREGVGIDLASLAKFVAIQGTLTQPSVGVSGKGTAKSLLNIGAAISTGGLSLLASKLADTVISGDACETAKNAFSTNASGATQKTSAKPND
ncbi:AsmA family protein [Eionea flava]